MNEDTRRCGACLAHLPADAFIPSQLRRSNPSCRDCRNAAARALKARKRQERVDAKSALLASGHKTCSWCAKVKRLEDFHADRGRPDGRFSYCIQCRVDRDGRKPKGPSRFATRSDYNRHYLASLSDDERARRGRRRHLWTSFRITLEQYEVLFEAQDGRCAVCRLPEVISTSKNGKARSLAVDHDHGCCPGQTSCGNCIRGLLCTKCNTAIGALRDDPKLIDAAASYVRNARPEAPEQLRLVG